MVDLVLHIPPFSVRLRSPFVALRHHVDRFYGSGSLAPRQGFVDFDLQILPGKGMRRWWHPQVRFTLDGAEPFFPLPAAQAAPMLEWGLNWCIAQRPLGYSVMHAAVVARDDQALMMPGAPGAGKSTLCASLVLQGGWRLLSDELAILDPADHRLLPHPRPISVKNRSIDIVSAFPGAQLGPVYHDTRKGTLSHVACPADSAAAALQRARVAWIVFPKFDPDAAPVCAEIPRAEAFALISEQSFNRESMGEVGFAALCELLSGAHCHKISYRSTDEGLDMVRRVCGQ